MTIGIKIISFYSVTYKYNDYIWIEMFVIEKKIIITYVVVGMQKHVE